MPRCASISKRADGTKLPIPTEMAHGHDPEALSAELIAALRSLGGEGAPAELAERVELARMPRCAAPPELWARVAAELGLVSEPVALPRRGRVRSWPRWAAAAGILLVAGYAWIAGADPLGAPRVSYEESGLAAEVPPEIRRALIARLTVREVAPQELSPLTRAFMAGLAAPMRKDG